MPGRNKKKEKSPVFDSIRKPTAPPGQRFKNDKTSEKVDPAGRKSKHKKPVTREIENDA